MEPDHRKSRPAKSRIAHLAGTLEPSLPGGPVDRVIVATAIDQKAKPITADARLRQPHRVETVSWTVGAISKIAVSHTCIVVPVETGIHATVSPR